MRQTIATKKNRKKKMKRKKNKKKMINRMKIIKIMSKTVITKIIKMTTTAIATIKNRYLMQMEI